MKQKFYLYQAHPNAKFVVFPLTGNTPKDISDYLLRGRKEPLRAGEYIGPFYMPGLPTFKNAFLWKLDQLENWCEKRRIKKEMERTKRKWTK